MTSQQIAQVCRPRRRLCVQRQAEAVIPAVYDVWLHQALLTATRILEAAAHTLPHHHPSRREEEGALPSPPLLLLFSLKAVAHTQQRHPSRCEEEGALPSPPLLLLISMGALMTCYG